MAENGGARPGSGRKAKAEKFKLPIARAEKRIADRLPELIENMFVLANGGYERVEEQWAPAGSLYVGGGKMYPDLPDEELVLIKRTSSIADRDRAANQYLIDRIMGKPTERQEIAGAGGGAIEVRAVDYRTGLDALKPDDADA